MYYMDCQLLHRKKLSFFHCFIMMGIDFTFLDMFLYNRLLFAIVLTYWFWIAILLCLVLVFVVVSLETCNIKSNLLKTIKFIFFFQVYLFSQKRNIFIYASNVSFKDWITYFCEGFGYGHIWCFESFVFQINI